MTDHVRILGILFIVGGAFGLLVAGLFVVIFGLGALGIAGAAMQENREAILAIPIIGAIATILVGLIVVCSIPGIAAGAGLLKYQPWARILSIVLSALNLLNVPIGTALGIYGLWVLLNKDTEKLFLSPPVPAAGGTVPPGSPA